MQLKKHTILMMMLFFTFHTMAFTSPNELISSATFNDNDNDNDDNDDNDDDIALVVGYVSKQWASKVNGSTRHENLWGEHGKRLHGIQVGIIYKPKIPAGIGVYTGLLGEAYVSLSKAMGYDEFTEFSLYTPLHLNFFLPLSSKVALNAHGGLGLNLACRGSFSNNDAYYIDYEWDDFYGTYIPQKHYHELDHIRYGRDGWPKSFNAALEANIGIRINHVLISLGYSWGLTNHRFYKNMPNAQTLQDKMSLSVGFGF